MKTAKQPTVHNLKSWQKDIIKSGLNWEVEKQPLFDKSGNEVSKGNFRSDTSTFLGHVTDQYHIIQNSRLFQLANNIGGIKTEFDKAGEMHGGSSVYVRYKFPDLKFDVGNVGDISEVYFMMSTAHFGGALTFGIEALRLICLNGVTAIRRHSLFNVRHTAGAEDKLLMNQQIIKAISTDLNNYKSLMDVFAKTQLSIPIVGNIIENVFNDGEESNIHTSSVKQNKARSVLNLFELNDNDTFKKQRNTAYALLNAFSNYTDHNINYRQSNNETQEQSKARSILFGAGQALKMKALEEITTVLSKDMAVNIPNLGLFTNVKND